MPMKKPKGKHFYTLGGYCYQMAKDNNLLQELEDIYKADTKDKENALPVEEWHERKGEFYLFTFEALIQVANLLGYIPGTIHHEANAITMLIDDYKHNFRK